MVADAVAKANAPALSAIYNAKTGKTPSMRVAGK
jgi:hypothetical protein